MSPLSRSCGCGAYPASITGSETLGTDTADMEASFGGEYGHLVPAATLAIWDEHAPLGAVMTVDRAPWTDAPACPFVIELFDSPSRRRAGVARTLLRTAASALADRGDVAIAVRVERENDAARALYLSEGFRTTT